MTADLHLFTVGTHGLAAIHPSAVGQLFPAAPAHEAEPKTDNIGIAEVLIAGPIVQRPGGPFDSYPAILRRVVAAAESGAHTVLLRVDSPGGDVPGCWDTARAIRAAIPAGVRLVVHTEGMLCSAAYALACVADEITASSSARVGSVGVLEAHADLSEAAKAAGIRWTILSSGDRKTDTHPQVPVTDDARAAIQHTVNELAEQFFELVATHRKVTVKDLSELQAATLLAPEAHRVGLIDTVCSASELRARLGATLTSLGPDAATSDDSAKVQIMLTAQEEEKREGEAKAQEDDEKKSPEETARAALKALAACDDEKKARAARAALRALDGEDDDEKKDDDESAKAQAAVAPSLVAEINQARAVAAAAEAKAQEAIQALQAERLEGLLASRPDLTDELRASLRGLSFEQAQAVVASIKPTGNPFVERTVAPPTRGKGQGSTSALSPQASELDVRMGLVETESAVVDEGTRLMLGVRRPKGAQ